MAAGVRACQMERPQCMYIKFISQIGESKCLIVTAIRYKLAPSVSASRHADQSHGFKFVEAPARHQAFEPACLSKDMCY